MYVCMEWNTSAWNGSSVFFPMVRTPSCLVRVQGSFDLDPDKWVINIPLVVADGSIFFNKNLPGRLMFVCFHTRSPGYHRQLGVVPFL